MNSIGESSDFAPYLLYAFTNGFISWLFSRRQIRYDPRHPLRKYAVSNLSMTGISLPPFAVIDRPPHRELATTSEGGSPPRREEKFPLLVRTT